MKKSLFIIILFIIGVLLIIVIQSSLKKQNLVGFQLPAFYIDSDGETIRTNVDGWDLNMPSGDITTTGIITTTTLSINSVFTFPTYDGSADQVMKTDGSGSLRWAAEAGGANTALSNLASVAINTSLISDTDSTDDLGSSSIYWANAYIDKIYLNSTAILDGSDAGKTTFTGHLLPADDDAYCVGYPTQQIQNIYVDGTAYIDAISMGGNITPEIDSNINLGSSSKYWLGTYTDTLYLNSTAILDGTTAGLVNITGNVAISGTLNTHTIPAGTGTLALTSDLASYVPYTGATADLDLGGNSLNVTDIRAADGSNMISQRGLWNDSELQVLSFSTVLKIVDTTSELGAILDPSLITTADKTFTFPDLSGTIVTTVGAGTDVDLGAANALVFGDMVIGNVGLETNQFFIDADALGYGVILDLNSLTLSNKTFTFPDATGTFALTADLASYLPLTGGTISGILDVTTLSINSAFTFPTWDGSNGQVMITDGAGNLSWSNAGTGDITDVWDCASGNCETLTAGASDVLDATLGMIVLPIDGTVDTQGDISWDTTSGQLKIYDGSAIQVIVPDKEICFALEDPVDADDNVPFYFPRRAITITDVYCQVDGGTSVALVISDGTNALESITCDDDGAEDDGSIANGTFTSLERMEFDLDASSGTNTWLNVCITYTITGD